MMRASMRAIMWAIIAGALVLAGCKEADKPARVDDKPVAPKPDEKPVKVAATPPVVEGTLDGAPIRYLSALALFNDDEVSIQLFPGTIDCDKERPDSTNRLAFTVNSGPERTFYAGRDLAVRVSIDGVSTWFSPAAATVKLAPFAPKQGARLTGTIAFDAKADGKAYKVAGRFDAQLCRSYEPTPPALPAPAPPGPLDLPRVPAASPPHLVRFAPWPVHF